MPSRGSPQAGGGQSPSPADWPAPRKARGPQTWQRGRGGRQLVTGCAHSPGRARQARSLADTRASRTRERVPRHIPGSASSTHTTPPTLDSSSLSPWTSPSAAPSRPSVCPAGRSGLPVQTPLCCLHPQAPTGSPSLTPAPPPLPREAAQSPALPLTRRGPLGQASPGCPTQTGHVWRHPPSHQLHRARTGLSRHTHHLGVQSLAWVPCAQTAGPTPGTPIQWA